MQLYGNDCMVCGVSDCIFLASPYECQWSVIFFAVYASHLQCTVSVIAAEFIRGLRWSRNLDTNLCTCGDINPGLSIGSPAC